MERILKSMKTILITVNVFFVLTGVITLYVGITAFLVNNTYYYFWTPGYFVQPMVCMGAGSLILLLAAAGFYGVIRENYLIIIAYIVAMASVPIILTATSISSFAIRQEKLEYIPINMAWSMRRFTTDPDTAEQWARLQQEFECCGASNATEWLPYVHTMESNLVPVSCCSRVHVDYCTVDAAFPRGCSSVFVDYMRLLFDAIGYGGIMLALMQVLIFINVVSSLWLVKIARERNAREIRSEFAAS